MSGRAQTSRKAGAFPKGSRLVEVVRLGKRRQYWRYSVDQILSERPFIPHKLFEPTLSQGRQSPHADEQSGKMPRDA